MEMIKVYILPNSEASYKAFFTKCLLNGRQGQALTNGTFSLEILFGDKTNSLRNICDL